MSRARSRFAKRNPPATRARGRSRLEQFIRVALLQIRCRGLFAKPAAVCRAARSRTAKPSTDSLTRSAECNRVLHGFVPSGSCRRKGLQVRGYRTSGGNTLVHASLARRSFICHRWQTPLPRLDDGQRGHCQPWEKTPARFG